MAIAGVNSLSSLSGAPSSERVSALLSGNNAAPESFTGTLTEQAALLSAAINRGELPKQLQDFAQSKITSVINGNGVFQSRDDLQELAALLGKELPVSCKINEQADPEANSAALVDMIKSIAAAEKAAASQNMDKAAVINVPPQPDPRQLASSLSTEKIEDATEDQSGDSQTDVENSAALLQLLTAWLLPEAKPAEKKMDDSSAKDAVIKENAASSFLKPLAADNKLNLPEEEMASDSFLTADFNASAQDKQQGIDLNAFEKALVNERQPASLGMDKSVIDKAAPQQIHDMAQLDKPLAARADVPAIIKPLAHPDWSKDLGDRIIWMNNKAVSAAEIRLNPQHLGPLSVRIDINQDQATVTFSAQHGAVREALEASVPRLREMMSSQQLNLVDVNIFQQAASDQGRSSSQGFSQTAGDGGPSGGNTSGAAEGVSELVEDIENGQAVISQGLLSLYA
ncbi:putative Flagellar hook-length control protein FliK [Candidatus Methylobacter favarea]|uniref:Putative Flagellar hook-length control protein FliK n=1 Tax=Candidatus Methylobacter favarea TaxID=2707345 RepID=A0A8S0WBM5_9GAMM|nr:flagellar hook-length control protein FliK [Candidatus Methylobacter favarea]CAA9891803.1 putative Flagellar hook-length control protein FliK [Candidatus Methylobacter favarea]